MMEKRISERPVLICNVDGTLYAMEGTCPHRNGPLAFGALQGHTVVCPWHAWEFDCRTGASDVNEDLRLAVYPVRVEDGDVLVELD